MKELTVWSVILGCSLACTGSQGNESPGGENASPSTGVAWPLDSSPVLDIPGVDANGDLRFGNPTGATRLSNGRIVVGDGPGSSVTLFDAAGRPRRTIGSRGSGPGEFRNVSWLAQCAPDSVFVWDARLYRVTVIDALGNAIRQFRLPADPSSLVATVECSPSGRLAIFGFPLDMRPPSPDGESPHYKAPLWLADADGHVTHALGDVPLMESRPLGKFTALALSSRFLYVGTNEGPIVDVYTLDGMHRRTIETGVATRRATARHYERAIDAQVAGLTVPAQREDMKQRLLRIPMPEHLPWYTALLTDGAGTVWVQVSGPGDGATWLRAIAPNGSILADVHVPLELRVFEIGHDYVLGAYDDETGEPHIAMYRLHRGG